MSEPNELVDGYDPADPPQGDYYCRRCSNWDDDCTCGDPDEREIFTCNWRVFRRGAYEMCGQVCNEGEQYCPNHERSSKRKK